MMVVGVCFCLHPNRVQVLHRPDMRLRDVHGASAQCGPGALRSVQGPADPAEGLCVGVLGGRGESHPLLPLHQGPAVQGKALFIP